MKTLQWVESGDGCVANLQHGRVVITPTDPPNPYRPYTVRIETASGEVVSTDSFDLEGCKAWATDNLTLMDQVSGELGDCGNVLETLEMCQQLLRKDIDANHWLRVEHIKQWIARYIEQTYDVVNIPLPEHSTYELKWVEEGNTFYTDTPYGRAVIEETRRQRTIGGGIRHTAKIVHYTGAVLDCYSWVDFMEAEAAINKRLTELAVPRIDEMLVDYLDFTFDICERILPEETDPIHYARLETLKMRMHFDLD